MPQQATSDPYAAIATPLPASSSAPAAAAAPDGASADPYSTIATPLPPQDYLSKTEDAIGAGTDFLTGAAKGAVQSAGETVQSLPFIGKHIISPEAMQAERATFAPGSPAEQNGDYAGKIAEPILEFVLGDEALKGLSLADKVGLAGKINDIAKTSPYIAKIMQHGVLAARLGTVESIDQLAHGATPSQAATRGMATGLVGSVADAGLKAGSEAASKLQNPFRTAEVGGTRLAVTPAFATTGREIASQQAVRNVASDVSGAAGGVPVSQAESIRNVWAEPTEALKANAKQYYSALDNASDGQWSRVQNKVDSIRAAMRNGTGDYDKLLAQKTELEGLQDEILQNVPQGTETAARKAWAQYSRAEDLHDVFDKYGIGTRSEMATPGVSEPEKGDWKGLLKQLNKWDPQDLTDAMGGSKQAAKDLIGTVDLASRKGWAADRTAKTVKAILEFGLGYALGRH